MDYELLLKQIQELNRKTKELQDSQKKYLGFITKDSENGDLKQLSKDLGLYADRLKTLSETNAALQELVASFDGASYMSSGEYGTQLLEYCKQAGVDVIGASPTFEMFPFKVKIDSAEQAVYVNSKKVNCLRPRKFVETVSVAQSKMSKSSFNADQFAKELASAYDLFILKNGKKQGIDVTVKNIYNMLTPTAKIRKYYDVNTYAYDLSRFVEENQKSTIVLPDGRRFQISPAHDKQNGIRILPGGKEMFIYQIRLYTE